MSDQVSLFKAPSGTTYRLDIEERPDDEYDRYCITATNRNGYDDWTSSPDLREAIGVAVMRAMRHELQDNCLCRACVRIWRDKECAE